MRTIALLALIAMPLLAVDACEGDDDTPDVTPDDVTPDDVTPDAVTPDAVTPEPSPLPDGVVEFAGYLWEVKSGTGLGPGPNSWSSSPNFVWVDEAGLHLRIAQVEGTWYCAEVMLLETLGYGRYQFTFSSAVDVLDPQAVLGAFLYRDDAHEIDLELTRWGDPLATTNGQYVVQPYMLPDHLERFSLSLDERQLSTHTIDWGAEAVVFQSYLGATADVPEEQVASWTFGDASAIPSTEGMAVHLNLWLYEGAAPQDGQAIEVVISDFRFAP